MKRYKITVRATDMEIEEEPYPVYPVFVGSASSGAQGNLLTGKDADCFVSHAKGRTGCVPSEIEELPVKKLSSQSLQTADPSMPTFIIWKCKRQSMCKRRLHWLHHQ